MNFDAQSVSIEMLMYEMKKDNFECHLEDQIRIRVNKFFNIM